MVVIADASPPNCKGCAEPTRASQSQNPFKPSWVRVPFRAAQQYLLSVSLSQFSIPIFPGAVSANQSSRAPRTEHHCCSILGATYGWSQLYKRVGTLKMSNFGPYSSHVHKYMAWMHQCCLHEPACRPCLKGKRILGRSNYYPFWRRNMVYHRLRRRWGRSMLLRLLRLLLSRRERVAL